MKVLTGGKLIDGTGAGPQPDATVVVRDERIEAVITGPAGEWPQDAEIIDVSGMTILPGLIDCHDHMAMHGYDLARRWGIDEPQSTRTLRTAKVLEQTLAMGYTAVRDAAGLDAGFKRAIDEGLISGPRLVVSLCIISPIGGIGDRVSPSGFSCCVPQDPLLPDGVVNSLADVRPVVRRVVRAGADVIKCATTGGASSRPEHGPRDGAFNLDEMQALTEEAHALDRRVMCHALGGRGLRIAIEAGVDSIEHGCYLDEEPELLDAMAERGIFFVPTFAVYDFHRKSPLPHIRERAHHLREHHIESLRRALRRGGQDRRRNRRRRPRSSVERSRDRVPRPRRSEPAPGITGGNRMGRRMPRPRTRVWDNRERQARRSDRRRRGSARRRDDPAEPRPYRAGAQRRSGRGEPHAQCGGGGGKAVREASSMSGPTRPLALVTGASGGIGADLARELAKDGHDLVLSARTVPAMEALAAELEAYGATSVVIAADLAKPAAAAELFGTLEARGLQIDVLVNNAGLGGVGRFDQTDPQRVSDMLMINVVALTELTRLLVPGMVARRRGKVLLVASTASFQPGPRMAVYFATKAYVLSLGEALAYELRRTGVTVTTLCPGATATNFFKAAGANEIALAAGDECGGSGAHRLSCLARPAGGS